MDALRRQCGVPVSSFEEHQRALKEGTINLWQPSIPVSIPDHFDAAENWPACGKLINDIRDQSDCGCCWAFAAAEAASDRMCIASNGKIVLPLSARNLCFCASRDGCNGGQLYPAWYYIGNTGLVTGGQFNHTGTYSGTQFCQDWRMGHCHHHGPQGKDPYPDEGTAGCPKGVSEPHCPSTCDHEGGSGPHDNYSKDKYGYQGHVVSPADDADSIAQMIMEHGPVEAAFIVYEDFANYTSGIYHHVSGEMAGGHAVKLVGWGVENGTKYWKVANSWNPYWGEEGFFRILRGTNECQIEGQVTANDPDATWGPIP